MSLQKAITCFFLTTTVLAYNQFGSNVTLMTPTNFYHLVGDENVWVINFYSSKSNGSRNFAKEFALSADILKGIVKFGAIDIEGDKEFAKNFSINVKHLPIVKFYGILSDRRSKDYIGPKLAKDLVESVLTNILDKIKKRFGKKSPVNYIKEVTDDNFDKIITKSKEPWMVLFYAPWCVHCKELKPIWSLVASTLHKKIKCASLDATTNKIKAREYEIKEYPTIKLLPFKNKTPNHVFDYTQDRTVDNIVDWALEKLPGPDIVQVTNVKVFQTQCMEQNLCIISALPSIFDCENNCRKNYLNILQKLGEKYKKRGWGWVWTEAGAQKGLESALHIGGFGYPTMVVLNPLKMKYSVFKGAFTKSRIDEFLTKLAKVKAVGVAEDVVERIVTVEAWNENGSINEFSEDIYSYEKEFGGKDEL